MNKRLIGVAGGLIVAIGAILYFALPSTPEGAPSEINPEVVVEPVVEAAPEIRFGIDVTDFEVKEGKIKRNQTFADILSPYNVSRQDIFAVDRQSKSVFSVRNFVPGKKYTLIYENDSIQKAAYFVYEPNALEYVIYQLKGEIDIRLEEREVEIRELTMADVIDVSLDHSIRREGGSAALVNAMADLYGWQIDPRSLQKGDWFKVVYEQKFVDGEPIGIGDIITAEFSHLKNSYMAYAYDDGNGLNYYDENGKGLQKAFLRYPVEFSRISSRYNPKRYLKMYGKVKPHLGTDFAAPRGTPIKAAGDGVIVARAFTKPNGNYVKIKHNSTYTTGYLHMSKFGKFRNGQRVRKGDIIGYVGNTGYSTGNHLCFRFWKRGKQVDFLKERKNLPSQKPLGEEHHVKFDALMSLSNKVLDDVPMPWAEQTVSASADKP